jgi:DNA-directed RNA polymerase specialized sigma24 family protein
MSAYPPLAAAPRVISLPAVRQSFPLTRLSLVAGLASDDAGARLAAADLLARAYWGPVCALLRLRWRLEPADAEDLTQDFFSAALEKNWLARYDPARARFRTFLRTCADRFAANAVKARTRLKRGGGGVEDSIESAEAALLQAPEELDVRLREEWVRSILGIALDALRAEAVESGKETHVAVFEAYDVDDAPDDRRPTYRQLANRFGIPDTQVTNYLNWSRRAYRAHVLATLRALSGNDAEFREDARELLGPRRS